MSFSLHDFSGRCKENFEGLHKCFPSNRLPPPVGRGPVPRRVQGTRRTGPRATFCGGCRSKRKKSPRSLLTVGRGPVPRRVQGTRRQAPARRSVEGYRSKRKKSPRSLLTVGRGPVPRQIQGTRGTGPRATFPGVLSRRLMSLPFAKRADEIRSR